MMKKALVTITDSHCSDGEDYSLELTTSGEYAETEDGFILAYDEADEELDGCMTELRFSFGGRIAMRRVGYYTTPYGELMMGIYTKSVTFESLENGGRLRFAYTIDFNNDLASENELDITFTLK